MFTRRCGVQAYLLQNRRNMVVMGTEEPAAFHVFSGMCGGADPLPLPLFNATLHALPQMYAVGPHS